MKACTERDLLKLKSDLSTSTRTMQSACFNFSTNTKTSDSQSQVRYNKYLHIFGVYCYFKKLQKQRARERKITTIFLLKLKPFYRKKL